MNDSVLRSSLHVACRSGATHLGARRSAWQRLICPLRLTEKDLRMSGLLALLDDVAAIAKVAAASVDDIAAAAKAGAKAAGVVIDDTAVTPTYVTDRKSVV